MFGHTYYYGLTRKYIIAFGTLMNDIYIERTDSQGSITQKLKVPLTYAPKDKMMARVEEDAKNLNRPTALVLPYMSFELTSLQAAPQRKKNTLNQFVRLDEDANKNKMMYQSVPYDLSFNLYIYVKNAEDGTKILEQILPYFKPQWDMTLLLIPEMDIRLDVPIIIGSPSSEDKYDGAFTQRRSIIWTVPFTLQGEYFGIIKKKPIIKFSKQKYYIGNETESSDLITQINLKPGLTPEGLPTNNENETIDPNEIYATDDFGFIVDFEKDE